MVNLVTRALGRWGDGSVAQLKTGSYLERDLFLADLLTTAKSFTHHHSPSSFSQTQNGKAEQKKSSIAVHFT